jgi:hypothetical protein
MVSSVQRKIHRFEPRVVIMVVMDTLKGTNSIQGSRTYLSSKFDNFGFILKYCKRLARLTPENTTKAASNRLFLQIYGMEPILKPFEFWVL